MRLLAAVLAAVLLCACTSHDPPSPPAMGEPTTYVQFSGQPVPRYAWEGRNVVFLTVSAEYDPATMRGLLAGVDAAYDYYASASPRDPIAHSTYRGKLAIAEVDVTCGAGCGYFGGLGIELRRIYWRRFHDAYADSGQFDQIVFYELGRNFWMYDAQAGRASAINTGYANLMRLTSIAAAGLTMAPWNELTEAQFRAATDELLQTYLRDGYTWADTVAANRPVPNDHGLGASDLFAAMLLDIARRHYGDPVEFARVYWHALDRRPDATDEQMALDNMALAACETVRADITGHLAEVLRWPVSASARHEAQRRYPSSGGE
jgi:serralysin